MPQALQKLRGAQSITSFSSYCSPPKSGRFLLLCRRAEGLFKSLITIQYDYTMQSANFSIPISAQICNISMNAATLHRIICPPTAKFKQEDLQNRKRTGKQGKAVPTLLLANLRTLPASHLASKVAWSHFFACWGNLSPSPFERFLQNRLRSCGLFFACGASENRGVMRIYH